MKNVKNVMEKEKLNKILLTVILFITTNSTSVIAQNYDRIILQSEITINCYLLNKGKSPYGLNSIKYLNPTNLKQEKISITYINKIYTINNKLIYQSSDDTQTKKKKPKTISCISCNKNGYIIRNCNASGCSNGKIQSNCTSCNGNYMSALDLCPKCSGTGCDYCDYDGQACDECTNGKKSTSHQVCSGLGRITQTCTTCNGDGTIIK